MQSVAIDDATVTVQLDRGVLPAGGTLPRQGAILVRDEARDRPHPVTVDMATLEDMGFGGERVPNPPTTIDQRKVVLQAQPGGGPPVVASVKLGTRREQPGSSRWFDIYVSGHRAKLSRNSDEAAVAHAGVATWSGNAFPVTIEPPASIPVEGPFTVAVRVKNTTAAPFSYVSVIIGGQLAGWDSLDGLFELGTDDYDITEVKTDHDSDEDRALAPGAEALLVYRVTPKRPGIRHFTFVTHVTVDNDRGRGAMDVAAFDRPEPAIEPATPSLAVR